MAWERQKAYIPDAPPSPQVKTWLLAALVAVVFGVLLFVLHASNKLYLLQHITIWGVALTPVIGWMAAFCVRSYFYGQQLSEYHFLQDEAQTAQREWQNWAERYMAVIAHTILLPDKITASFLAKNPKDFPPQYGLTKRIDYLPEQGSAEFQAISLLLNSIAEKLNALPPEITLHVTLLADSSAKEHGMLRAAFLDCWSAMAHGRLAPENITLETALPYDLIDSRLKDMSTAADLLLILQRQGEDDYSDGLGVFLLTPDDVAQKYQLPVKGCLLRPMTTAADSLEADLMLFMETQVVAQKAQGIVADGRSFISLTANVLPTTAAFNSSLTTENILVQERFTGIPGPFSAWLIAGLGLDFACQHAAPYLVFTQTEQHWSISTVSSWSNNEIVQ